MPTDPGWSKRVSDRDLDTRSLAVRLLHGERLATHAQSTQPMLYEFMIMKALPLKSGWKQLRNRPGGRPAGDQRRFISTEKPLMRARTV